MKKNLSNKISEFVMEILELQNTKTGIKNPEGFRS